MSLSLHGSGSLRITRRLRRTSSRAIPASGPRVMIDIVGSAKVILPAFPACGKSALGIFEWARLRALTLISTSARNSGRPAAIVDAGWPMGHSWLG